MSGLRLRNLLLMLPFFLIGLALPIYFFGFVGDGTPVTEVRQAISPVTDQVPSPAGYGVVTFVRSIFDGIASFFISPSLSPLVVKLGIVGTVILAGFIFLRSSLGLVRGALGDIFAFFIHKAAGPMFMGFLAVGSTWGIHETIYRELGLGWAAATVSMTAAIAALFALAGVRIRG
jgi:hypothetical protein